MTTFIKIPFASSGDKTNPPDTDAAGGVNWTQGYPIAYSRDPATDPSAKRIEREGFNGTLNVITKAINELQSNGVGTFITSADNGGSPFAYGLGALAILNGVVYQSKVDANVTTPPGASWQAIVTTAPGRLIGVKVLSSSGTYTKTPGTDFIEVEGWGGGAGAGVCGPQSNTTRSASGGGGGGAYARVRFNSGFDSVSYTIGSKGNGGTQASGNGGNGTSSIFGTLMSLAGGGGTVAGVSVVNSQTGLVPGGFGGTTITVDPSGIILDSSPGGCGGHGFMLDNSLISGTGGGSGPNHGPRSVGSNNTGESATAPGCGGSGSTTNYSAVGYASGGSGANGQFIVYEFSLN